MGADLAALSLDEMTAKFGRSAHYWFDLSRGIDDRQVQPNRERKSIGAEDTFREDIATIDGPRKMTVPLIEKVWAVCQHRNLYGRTVTLKVKFSDFEQITRARSRPLALTNQVEFLAIVDELLASTFPPTKPVRLLAVTISNFDRDLSHNHQQMMLPIMLGA